MSRGSIGLIAIVALASRAMPSQASLEVEEMVQRIEPTIIPICCDKHNASDYGGIPFPEQEKRKRDGRGKRKRGRYWNG